MVKPDAKHDYYADLELPATADAEDVKRQFRQLAKQYHPDRNPGREVDVVAKFQAVQAAHEILSDAQLKTKYDQERAKSNRVNTTFGPAETDPYNFRKPTARPAPSASQFPPPPRRTQTGSNARFTATNSRPPGPTAPGVEKFKAFTEATSQQWDRAKFEEAARADAVRGFQSMKSARAFPGQQMPPPQPARPPRAPTAPRTNAFDSTSPNDDQPPPGPGFPGMSRTANMRRSGFDPSSPSPGMDEQQAPSRASAYASYSRGERPQASNAYGYFPEGVTPQSPPSANKKSAGNPLRHVQSESGWDPPHPHRPDLERVSSKYANTSGERTTLGRDPGHSTGVRTSSSRGLGRSASVRTSPVERHWDETHGQTQPGRPHSHHGPPRNHSSSPKLRPSGVPIIDYSSSSSESSEDGRRSFAPRRPRVYTSNSEQHGYRPFSEDDPALTGQFPSNNYTKIVEDNNKSSQYNFPPPIDGPVRRPFSNMASPENARPSMNGNGLHPDDGIPNQRRPPPEHIQSTDGASNLHSVSEENKNSKFTAADWEGKFGSGDEFLRPNIDTSDRDRRSPTRNIRPRARSTGKVKLNAQGHVQENVSPMPGMNGHNQPQAASGTTEARSGSDGDTQFVHNQEQPKSTAFQAGKFSADEWAEKLKEQMWSIPASDLNPRKPKSTRKQSKSVPRKQTTAAASAEEPFPPPNDTTSNTVPGDAMDIDGDSMENIPPKLDVDPEPNVKTPSTAPRTEGNADLNVNLEDLKHAAPFAPSATGLKDLDDLSNTLPFESRAAPSVDPTLNRTISSTARRLDLPKPPKTVIPPAEASLTQEAWETYIHNINTYLHDWNVFNIKMLDHFRTRQDQINVGMRNNWISSVGDGPSVEAFDAAGDSSLRAGFATYMAWLEDDARCRSWWDTANERHRECFEDLARVRETVKKAAGVV